VRLVGIADQVCRVGTEGAWCVLEFKTGRTSPESDLGQACLYHLILSQLSAVHGKKVSGSALALISFAPEPREMLFTSAQLLGVRARLLDLIGQLGGVLGAGQDLTVANGGAGSSKKSSRVAVQGAQGGVSAGNELPARIMAAFREYGVDVRLSDEVQSGPAFLRFTIIPGVGTKVAAIEKLAAELQIRLGLTAEPFISRDQGRVVMDIQRPDRQMVYFEQIRDLLPASHAHEGNARVPVGVDFSGELVFADLSQPEHCHLLVAGTTGSGKSEWLRLALAGLMVTNTPETLRLVVIDPKRNAFHALQGSPFLWCPVVFPDEQPASEILEALCVEMESRYRRLDGADTIADAAMRAGMALPRIVCVCDEYRDLISRSRAERHSIEALISRLGAKARAAGIHLILATQEASRETIKGPLDANIPARVGLKMGRPLESRMLLGIQGAEKLLGYGDLLFKDTQPPRRLQAPLLTEADRTAIFGGV
jgi:DNA segregation ATPase FtsK/SpoIIIE-like protein